MTYFKAFWARGGGGEFDVLQGFLEENLKVGRNVTYSRASWGRTVTYFRASWGRNVKYFRAFWGRNVTHYWASWGVGENFRASWGEM